MIVLQILSLLGLAALWLLLKRYLPSYVVEKGKNLATKEDIADITERIESVKASYAADLEGVRAAITSRLGVHQFRYQREYDLLLQLSEKVVTLRDAALALRPTGEFVDPDESADARRLRKWQRYHAAGRDLYVFYEARQAFFPLTMVNTLRALDQLAWVEAVQFRHAVPENADYWEKAAANAEAIGALATSILAAVRNRVQFWETFEAAGDDAV